MASLTVGSDQWKGEVARLYLEGYGFEDIAVSLACTRRDVLDHMIMLSVVGQFARIEEQRRNLWLRKWNS